jgi:class 3 adenylate cyclase/tetratricopeptide (TPR) repeat protein
MSICARCGHENADDARFCSGCGAVLAGEEKAGETRKVVTIVFTDLVGSTSLGEQLDPETLRLVMSRYFDAMQATLERHGGTVEKFIGDAIMAVFGIPTLHEDDALRAARAAIEMRAALAELNEDLERRYAIRLATRTGVNTGQVVAGDASAQQKLATGDAVNVAARLEQAAGPGEILLGEGTRRLVGESVGVEQLEPLAVKGKAAPLPVWRALELLPDVPAFTRPIAAPFVGRDQELAAVRGAFDQAARDRTCTLATVIGPPGIGKSRLARELVGTLGQDARVVVGRCLPYGEGVTYAPLGEIVHQVAGSEPERGVAALVAGDNHAGAISGRIAAAVGASDHIGSPEEIAWAFRKLFESVAREQPLVVVVDDIHWAEPTLLDLLEYVGAFSSGAAIMLLCLARPDLLDTHPAWAAPRPNRTLVSLSPLSDDDTQTLIERLLHARALSDKARARIVEAAEGNPLFVEQILALQAEDPDVEVIVPPTIQALLAARIDRLEADERAVLVRASVEGRLFHRGAVAELLPPAGRTGLGAQLMSLVRKEFVRPDRALFPGDDGFRFNHVLIRDAAYDSMTKQLRAELHERYAKWLEHQADGHVVEFEEYLGHHLERSYRLRVELGQVDHDAEALAVKAGRLLTHAGRRAAARGDAGAAARLLERAVDLLSVDPQARLQVLPDYGLALREGADLPAAERVLEGAIEEAARAGDERSELRAQVQLAWVLLSYGADDWAGRARRTAERAVEVFEQLNDEGELAGAWVLLGVVESLTGNGAAAVAAHLRAHEHARAVGDDRRQVEIWNELGGAMIFSRTPVEELIAFRDQEAAWALEKGFPFLEADAALIGPYLYPMLGRFDEGRELLAKSKSIFGELGARYNVAEASWAGAQLELLAGDAPAAERELREALQIHEEMGATRYSAFVRAQLANVLLAQGRDVEAEQLLEQAQAAGATENIRFQHVWRLARAKLLAGRGEMAEAVSLAREAVAIVAATDNINAHAEALVNLSELLRADGEEAEADGALKEAVRLYEEKGNLLGAERARNALLTTERAGL